jgi:hypothetical protein
MVKGVPKRKSGIASIMDAFMFLMAMIALSSFLILAEGGEDSSMVHDMRPLVERAHSVLVSTTLRIPVDNDRGLAPTVDVLSLIQRDGGAVRFPDWAIPQVQDILSGLLGGGWSFEWSYLCDDASFVLVSSGPVPRSEQVFASTVDVPGATGYGLMLRAWMS